MLMQREIDRVLCHIRQLLCAKYPLIEAGVFDFIKLAREECMKVTYAVVEIWVREN